MHASTKEHAIWLLDELAPASGVNNIPVAVRVSERLRWWPLRQALDVVLSRHEVLRTVFLEEDGALCKSSVDASAFPVEPDVRETTPESLGRDLREYTRLPFALGAPLVRAAHFLCPGGDVFCFVAHHSVFDARSAAILVADLRVAYDALCADREPPGELLAVRHVAAGSPPRQESVEYWRARVSDVDIEALDLRCGNEPPAQPSLAGARLTHDLSDQAVTGLRKLRGTLRATDNIILLSAFAVLLAGHGSGPDLVLGVPLDGRGPADQDAIGFHINTLPLRLQVHPESTFRDLVSAARTTFLDAISHGDTSTEDILENVPRNGKSWRCPLFRHMFNYLPVDDHGFVMDGMPAALTETDNGCSRVDLEFFVLPSPNGTRVKVLYSTEVHDEPDVGAMVTRFDALLTTLGEDPDQRIGELPLVGDQDRAVMAPFAVGRHRDGTAGVLELVAATVARYPDAVALLDGEQSLTYGDLWRSATRLANRFLEVGVGAGDVVGVSSERQASTVAAVLATWMVGAAFVPLDVDQPRLRLAHLVSDSAVKVIVAADPARVRGDVLVMAPDAPGGSGDEGPVPDDVRWPDLETCAYVMYTSGSSGRPKGVAISHASLANVLAHFADELGAGVGHRMAWLTSLTFDPSLLEVLMPLVTGGCVVVAPDEARLDGDALRASIAATDPHFIQATPTTWRAVLDDVADLLGGRTVLSGGEPLPAALARRLVDTGSRVFNVYGPTEATIWCTTAELTQHPGDEPVIGRALANTTVFVADDAGRELPPGLVGELCVAGVNVAIGYLGLPDLTAERFREHPAHGRYYRTGDLARWRHDGGLELLGRSDRQVKLRGNRIELGEVEHVLAEHGAVSVAAVVAVGDRTGSGRLVAFIVPAEQTVTGEELWEHARTRLPDAALPAAFQVVAELPVNGSGKVDYPALVTSAETARQEAGTPAARNGAGPVEPFVGIWRAVLGTDAVSATTNFFTNGGNSLLAARLVQQVVRATGWTVKLRDVFDAPTPAALAERLSARNPSEPPAEARA